MSGILEAIRTISGVVLYVTYRVIRRAWQKIILDTFFSQPFDTLVSRILFRKKLILPDASRACDFLVSTPEAVETSQESQVERQLLENPRWTLYAMDREYVYFVLLPREASFYNAKQSPFFYLAQFENATHFGRMTLFRFTRLTMNLNLSQRNVILLTNTARSGSTLTAQILQVPGVTVFAEMDILVWLTRCYKDKSFEYSFFNKIVRSTFAFLCRHQKPIETYVFKTRSVEVGLVPKVRELFPNFKHLFLYRGFQKSMISTQKMAGRDGLIKIFLPIYRRFPWLIDPLAGLVEVMGFYALQFDPKDTLEVSFMTYAVSMAEYFHNKHHFDMVFTYEELLANPQEKISEIYKMCGIGVEGVEEGMRCLEEDSQRGTPMERGGMDHVHILPLDHHRVGHLQTLGRNMKLPEQFLATFQQKRN